MDFREATDEISIAITHSDIADAAGASLQSVRQARLDDANRAHRAPPSEWKRTLAGLARSRGESLLRLAGALEFEADADSATTFSLFRHTVSPLSVRLPSGRRVPLTRCRISFDPWSGPAVRNRYGGRSVIEFGGRPLFPELAVLHALKADGWDGVWVDSLRQKHWVNLPDTSDPVALPRKQGTLLSSILRRNGGPAGAWEVLAWKENRYLFARPLRVGQKLLASQLTWIESALHEGLDEEDFLLVEWDLTGG